MKEVKTIGLYYYRMYNGGVERVMARLSGILVKAGYKTVIITDAAENKDDYSVPTEVKRIVLDEVPGKAAQSEELLAARKEKLSRCIRENEIDCIIYNAWMSVMLKEDMDVIKAAGAYTVVYMHGNFATSLYLEFPYVLNALEDYKGADAVVTLSDVDKAFWHGICGNAFSVHNPPTYDINEQPVSTLDSKEIIWIGRVDDIHKNATDTVHILKKVCEKIPEAKLRICGSMNEEFENGFLKTAQEQGVRDNIILTGFVHDVQPYLAEASVHLLTSDTEGYSMSLFEACGAGLPTVSYELNYLTIMKESGACIQVKNRDISAAADAVISLLEDDDKRKRLGRNARKYVENISETYFEARWKEIIGSLAADRHEELRPEEYNELMERIYGLLGRELDIICEKNRKIFEAENRTEWEIRIGAERLKNLDAELRKELDSERRLHEKENEQLRNETNILKQLLEEEKAEKNRLTAETEAIRSSRSYKLGRTLTAIPRKLRKKQAE